MNCILLTGFEPFGGEIINPSWELVKIFDNQTINNHKIIAKEIPTVFYESAKLLKQYIDEFKPSIVICFGQAGGSKSIRLERVAINLNDASIPDNKGNKPIDELIIKDGPTAYFSTLPLREFYNDLIKENIPVSLSLSAGSYVCNHLFYHLMHYINNTNILGGFIHIPYLDIQVKDKLDIFSLTLDELKKALKIIINTLTKIN